MNTSPHKRSVSILGEKTSVSLEPVFWNYLKEAAAKRGQHINQFIEETQAGVTHGRLSSALRVRLMVLLTEELAGLKVPEDVKSALGQVLLGTNELYERPAPIEAGLPWCAFCKKHHEGGDTCMGHYP